MKNWMKRSTRQLLAKAMACLMCFLIVNGPVMAIDAADVISSSNADISTVGNTTTVNVLGDRSVTHWSNFNTTAGETLEFKRDSGAGFASLNIVESGTFTQFDGRLLGNQGSIYIINQHGLVFGATAEISAARFTASTLALDMTDTEFLNSTNENYAFKTGSAQGKIELAAGASVVAEQIQLLAHQISNSGVIVGTNDIVLLATGDEIYLASNSDDIIVRINTPNVSTFNYSIVNEAPGQIQNNTGKIVLAAGDTFAQALSGPPTAYAAGDYNVEQYGTIQAAELEIGAVNKIMIESPVVAAGDVNIRTSGDFIPTTDIQSGRNLTILANSIATLYGFGSDGDMQIVTENSFRAGQDVISGGNLALQSNNQSVYVGGALQSGGTMDVSAGTFMTLQGGAESGGTMTLDAGTRIGSYGDLVAQSDLNINANLFLGRNGDQTIESETGSVTAAGTVEKLLPGSLYIAAANNVRLDGNVTARSGGVSVIAENGWIGTGGGQALNVAISGYSNDVTDNSGADLPFRGPGGESLGKAAIVLQSGEDLILGDQAVLDARGIYAAIEGGVDDRPGVNFLAEDAVIGGYDRDQGIPSDVAIYVGSTGGDVIISESAAINVINSSEAGDATVVLDGMESVSMPNAGVLSGKFRLEAASRDSEWLFQAEINNRLPSLAEVEAVLGEGNYIRRGAGLDNAAITDGRQWVLENPETIPAPLAVLELPELKGCPVEMQAASAELGIPAETLQMTIRNALALNPNIQPCDACAGLVTAAAVLNDADGMRLAAMNQIFNTLAPADAPFTPEVSASVVTAFAQLGQQDRQYALAAEYIDAFVRYVAILDNELKAPVGDPVAFALEKHGSALQSEGVNPNIGTYILLQLMPEGI